MDDYKNALPDEVADDRSDDDDRLHTLHTQADNERPLTRAEAEVAGLIDPIYGEDPEHEVSEDRRDAEHAGPGEHL